MSEPSAQNEFAPPDCAVCGRSLLVGEAVQMFRDQRRRIVKVCELCRSRALELGFESLAVDTGRMRVHASGSLRDVVDRDALIEGLGNELEFLKQQLGEAEAALLDRELEEESLRAITDRLRRQERELERLRREVAPAQQLKTTCDQQAKQISELEQAVRTRDETITRLQSARIAECDPTTMCRHAIDAFNSSEHADRMMRIARTLGEPEVSVTDVGPALPRKVLLTLVWDIAWYEFEVKLDLGSGRASVRETGNGGEPRDVDTSRRTGNASWRSSGLVLAAGTPQPA